MAATNVRELLIGLGGREWQRGGRHRIYLPAWLAAEAIGLDVTFYGSGNVQSARLAGEPISNSEARTMIDAIDGVYYDVAADRFMGNYAGTIGKALRARIAP